AGACDPAGEGHDDVGNPGHGGDRPLGGGAHRPGVAADDQEIAATDAAGHADLILAEEFAIHHRNAPIAPLPDLLGDLEAVAEIAQLPAQLQLLRRLEA